ncbi:MAG: hypothetical protein WAT12_14120, partial [Candidatus Nitrotoga sp.]
MSNTEERSIHTKPAESADITKPDAHTGNTEPADITKPDTPTGNTEPADITKPDTHTGNTESDSDGESQDPNTEEYQALKEKEMADLKKKKRADLQKRNRAELKAKKLADLKEKELADLIEKIKQQPPPPPKGIKIPKIGNDPKHVRIYYSLEEATKIIKASKNIEAAGAVTFTKEDLLHFASMGKIRLITAVPSNVDIYYGHHDSYHDTTPLTHPDLLVLKSSYCRQIEFNIELEQSDFNDGFMVDRYGNVHSWPPSSPERGRLVWRTRNADELIKIKITQDRLFVMSFDLASFLDGKLPQQLESLPNEEFDLEGEHRSDQLQNLIQASTKFWEGKDPEDPASHPCNNEVANWLVEHRGFSPSLAKRSATIIRPEYAAVG